MPEKISVIMPAYNQAKYIREAIDSVLNQTWRDFELIVVNDGSTDETPAILDSYKDKIKVITKKNAGLAAARNTGIENSSGCLIAFLDSDDKIYPDMLSALAETLSKNPEASMAAGGADKIDENGKITGRYNNPLFFKKMAEKNLLRTLSLLNIFPVHTLLIRKKCFDKCGVFDESLRAMEDWDLWLRMASAGFKAVIINKQVSLYRIYSASMTFDGRRMEESFIKVLDKLFADNKTAIELSEIREYILASSWLRQAVNYYNSKDEPSAKRCLKMAEYFLKNTKQAGDIIWRHLSLMAQLPGTEKLAKKISAGFPEKLCEYYMDKANHSARNKKYFKAFCNIIKSFLSSPINFLRKTKRRIMKQDFLTSG